MNNSLQKVSTGTQLPGYDILSLGKPTAHKRTSIFSALIHSNTYTFPKIRTISEAVNAAKAHGWNLNYDKVQGWIRRKTFPYIHEPYGTYRIDLSLLLEYLEAYRPDLKIEQ